MKKENYKIAFITVLVHMLYLLMLPFGPKISQKKIITKPMKVVTKEITPPRARVVNLEESSKKEKIIPANEEVASFLPKSSPPIKKVVKKPIAKKKQPVKQAKTVRGKLDKNVAKIKAKKPPTKKQTPAKKEAPKIESLSPSKEAKGVDEKHEYLKKISHSLQEWLTLPEKGSVKLTITVQANGKIVNIEVVTKESEKNWEYLKTVLPGIQLPKFEENKEITFTITFCDD